MTTIPPKNAQVVNVFPLENGLPVGTKFGGGQAIDETKKNTKGVTTSVGERMNERREEGQGVKGGFGGMDREPGVRRSVCGAGDEQGPCLSFPIQVYAVGGCILTCGCRVCALTRWPPSEDKGRWQNVVAVKL
jgi:hypothetical protein